MSLRLFRWVVALAFPGMILASCNFPSSPTVAPTFTSTPHPFLTSTPTPTGLAPFLVGYFFSGSIARGYAVSMLPASRLDIIIYAFASISSQGRCSLLNSQEDQTNFSALKELKQKNPPLKTQISVGGWAHSALFSDVALSAVTRTAFVSSCIQMMEQNGFDGIDLDWEYPVSGGLAGNHHTPHDKENFTALLAEFRNQLDAAGVQKGQHFLLSIAAPAGSSEYHQLELEKISQSLDRIDLMAYGFATETSQTAYFKEPLYAPRPSTPARSALTRNADAAVKAYLTARVPPEKLLLGVAFYGQGWHVASSSAEGLYQAVDGLPIGTWGKDGVFSYQDLKDHFIPAFTRFFEPSAQVPWLYSPARQIFISYEDPQSLDIKAGYVSGLHLGGMMFWEASFDDTQHTLVNAIYDRFHP